MKSEIESWTWIRKEG